MYNKYTFSVEVNRQSVKVSPSKTNKPFPSIVKIVARTQDEAERNLEDMLYDYYGDLYDTKTYLLDVETNDMNELL